MLPELSLAHLTVLGLAPPEMVTTAARAGYSHVGLRLHAVTPAEPKYSLHCDPVMLRSTRRELAATGIQVLDVELVRLTPDFDVRAYHALLDVSAELGARHVIAQGADGDLSRVTEHFGSLCDAAASRGLTVDIEFVSWTETPDMERATRIIRDASRDNAGLLIDTLHFSRSNCSVADLAKLPRCMFHYVQVCDAPRDPPDSTDGLIHAARNERLFLGAGGLDLRGILAALPATLPYSLEIPNAALVRHLGWEEHARLASRTAKDFLAGTQPLPSARRSTRPHAGAGKR